MIVKPLEGLGFKSPSIELKSAGALVRCSNLPRSSLWSPNHVNFSAPT